MATDPKIAARRSHLQIQKLPDQISHTAVQPKDWVETIAEDLDASLVLIRIVRTEVNNPKRTVFLFAPNTTIITSAAVRKFLGLNNFYISQNNRGATLHEVLDHTTHYLNQYHVGFCVQAFTGT